MQPSVSLIIPVFNAELTIHETLASIESEVQLSNEINWQVIAIDDGSTDNSLQVVKDWQARIPLEIFLIPHSGGPAKPRNLGIEKSNSKYVFFLDSDDVLLPGGLSSAVLFAENNESDIVVCRLKSLDGRGVPRGMHKTNQATVDLGSSRIYWSLNPMKLIRRSLLIENNIRFAENMPRDEDQPFIFKAYLAAKTISVMSEPPVVGVRYAPGGTNLTLRKYEQSDLKAYLETMAGIMESAELTESTKSFLLIRNWEIEIAREMVWKRLALLDEKQWQELFEWLVIFADQNLEIDMLTKTSIRWRGVVGLIKRGSYADFEKLLQSRRRVINNSNAFLNLIGILGSNWIRLKSTLQLPR